MKKLTLTVGPSGSGKSTWARDQVRKSNGRTIQLNRDEFRFSMYGADSWNQYKFTASRENAVSEAIMHAAKHAATNGTDIIISDTNLNPDIRQKWVDFAKEHGYELELMHFPCDLRELLDRNRTRGKYALKEDIIRRQHADFMFQFGGWKKYVPDTSKPTAVIFDVDGTLVDNTGRSPFAWDRVHEDTPKPMVHALWHAMKQAGHQCIVVSGRDGVCKQATAESLSNMGIVPTEHFQRKEGDCRRDDIVKEEIFWENIADNYNVVLVVDDRQQVVDMWRRLGLECWQVAEGNF